MNTSSKSRLEAAIKFIHAGNVSDADRILSSELERTPSSPAVLHLSGLLAGLRGEHNRAEVLLRRALSCGGADASLFSNLAAALSGVGKADEAINFQQKALQLEPASPILLLGYGRLLIEVSRFEDALKSLNEVLKAGVLQAEALTNIGLCLHAQSMFEAAIESYEEAIRLNPMLAQAWANRGNSLTRLNRFEEALSCHMRALELGLKDAESHSNLGVSLFNLEKYEEALKAYEESLRLRPGHDGALNNRGSCLAALGHHSEALTSFNQALTLNPRNYDALHNKSLLELRVKNFSDGFSYYRHRWLSKDFPSVPPNTNLPLAELGLATQRLLLWGEQGLGDEIFYAGLLELANSEFPEITLAADVRLHPILQRSFKNIRLVEKNHSRNLLIETDDPECTSQAPVGDLGYLLNLDAKRIQATRKPFFTVRSDIASRMKSLIKSPNSKRLTCGLAWRSENKSLGSAKSMSTDDLRKLLQVPGVDFINLQYGKTRDEIEDFVQTNEINLRCVPDLDTRADLEGLLGLISACDVVVTTSNVTAHLAGAIGKTGLVLLPFGRGRIWYWHENDQQSFWYPSLSLVRQIQPQDWTEPIAKLKAWLIATRDSMG